MTRITMIVSCAIATLVISSTAQAAFISLTTDDGNGADTYVRRGYEFNYGDVALMYSTYSAANSSSRKAYVRFDLSSLPSGWQVSDATLKVEYVAASSSPIEIWGYNDGGLDENWTEKGANATVGIKWSSAPANDTTGAFFTADATGPLASIASAPTGVNSFTDQTLTDFINTDTDGLVTLMIVQASPYDWATLYQREHATALAPTLELTYTPEPATMGLLGIGGLFALRRRRR